MTRSLVARGMKGTALLLSLGACARPTYVRGPAVPLTRSGCHPEQVEVVVLGTFHFAQQNEVDIRAPKVQGEIRDLVSGLERFAPDRVAVEAAYADNDALNQRYRRYLAQPDETPRSVNEIDQIGFRLARRLGHDRVYGVDVPMRLWHDSIAVFDERHPGARNRLRSRWDVRYQSSSPLRKDAPLAEILLAGNEADPPPNSELYARFLPLVEEDIYAGALKLRPWYDRNLRTVQNLFRILEERDRRVLLVIGWGHVRTLTQILELTPQLCAVAPGPFVSSGRGPGSTGAERADGGMRRGG